MKDFEKIADEILCGVDYDIYKDDCNEMDNELRDKIEARLIKEFGCFDEMCELLSDAGDALYQSSVEGDVNLSGNIRCLPAKVKGE